MLYGVPKARLVAGWLLAAVAGGACASPSTPSAPAEALTPERIAGRWMLVGQQTQGEAEAMPPIGAPFSLEIVDGRAQVVADCNRCSGTVVVGTTTITTGPVLACTRAFCQSAPFDDRFLRILGGKSTATIDDGVLTLRSDRGVLRFQR
jgi:heat shock protein HslJ